MMATVWLAIGLGLLALAACRAGRVWRDASQWTVAPGSRTRWTLQGMLFPERYWWGVRLEAMSSRQRAELLAAETAALNLSQADAARCPLCQAEIPRAWTVTTTTKAKGSLPSARITPGPVQCPSCDFRLDACRHCARFSPGAPQEWNRWNWDAGDPTSGRCNHYRSVQAVETACAPDMARRLKQRGYDQIRAPLPIVDSYLPPDHCRAFQADQKRLRASGIRWPGARRVALLRLLSWPSNREAGSPAGSQRSEPLPKANGEWLL
jgi:hypothetical protein